jgi:hypothetical protein
MSEICGTATGMATPKGNMSTEGETVQLSVLPYRCSICIFCCVCLGCCPADFGRSGGPYELPCISIGSCFTLGQDTSCSKFFLYFILIYVPCIFDYFVLWPINTQLTHKLSHFCMFSTLSCHPQGACNHYLDTTPHTDSLHTRPARQYHQYKDCIYGHNTDWLHENGSSKMILL